MPISQDRDISLQRNNDASEPEDPRATLARFRKRLRAGDYDALIGHGLRRTLRGAAADAGLEAEIGALRITLVRLLNEENDPSRLAAGVSRVAGVAIQAARLRNALDDGSRTGRPVSSNGDVWNHARPWATAGPITPSPSPHHPITQSPSCPT